LVLFGSILWYVATKPPARTPSWAYGPFVLTLCGVILAMLDPTRHVLLDHGGVICAPQDLAMYADGEGHLSAVGTFCRWATIVGLTLMMSGVAWFLGLPAKVYDSVSS